MRHFFLSFLLIVTVVLSGFAQEHQDHHDPGVAGEHAHNPADCPNVSAYHSKKDTGYNAVETALHHISDANEFHIVGDIHLPLPVMVYAPEQGWTLGMSSMFHHGHTAVDRYVLDHGRVKRVVDDGFPMGEVAVCGTITKTEMVDGKEKEVAYVEKDGKLYKLDFASTADFGFFGGGITSFYDFSITKNVFTMILVALILILVFTTVARGYKRNAGKAPSGLQSFMEPFFVFIRDEVSIPMMGAKYERFQPFIMSIFFFVLLLNLFGLVPFFPGSSNVTGNLAVTLTLAVFTFIITNINGNKHYWEHIFWMPGIPAWVKVILTPVEILGLFIKPFSLMIRLFANISAGHIIILSLIGLIFVFGDNGESAGGAVGGGFIGILFTAFMNLIELIVAFIQAFIFAILSASYIGAATEEAHPEEHVTH